MPRKPVKMPDLETLEGLARIGITQQELADLCSAGLSTITAKLAREPYKTVWKRGQAEMKISCRRNLLRLAGEGNVAAAIFLAKAVLRMQEPPREAKVTGELTTTQTTYLCTWGGSNAGRLPPADDVEMLEGEAEEE